MIEERLLELIRAALETAAGELGIEGERPEPELLPTKQKEHGDFASNVALVLASRAGRNPREVAEAIRAAFPEAPFVERVEVAGPGFLNIFVTDGWLHDALRDVVASGASYGAGEPNGKRVQVEFLSANPTGPLHDRPRTQRRASEMPSASLLAHARVGASSASTTSTTPADRWIGSAGPSRRGCSSCSAATSGCPMTDTAATTSRRSPARSWRRKVGTIADLPEDERFARLRDLGAERILSGIKATLRRFGVRFDVYVSERDLAEAGEIEEAIRAAARSRLHRRRRGRGVVPLHGVRRRQGSRGDQVERRPHVLRRRLRVPHRQVRPRVRSRHLCLGRGPPRRRRSREGRRPGIGIRPRRGRDRPVPVRRVPPRRRAGEDEHARGGVRHAGRADRRGRHGCGALHAAAVLERLGGELRHRGREAADHGEPGVLRPVRARPDREHPAQGGVPGHRLEGRSPTSICRSSRTTASSICCARSPRSRASWRRPRSNGLRTG